MDIIAEANNIANKTMSGKPGKASLEEFKDALDALEITLKICKLAVELRAMVNQYKAEG